MILEGSSVDGLAEEWFNEMELSIMLEVNLNKKIIKYFQENFSFMSSQSKNQREV